MRQSSSYYGSLTALNERLRAADRPTVRIALVPEALEDEDLMDMVAAGLMVTGEDIAVPYDRFRDRIMFPISDWRGRIIAFGGRAIDKEVAAKYLNSPETPLFHKGATL